MRRGLPRGATGFSIHDSTEQLTVAMPDQKWFQVNIMMCEGDRRFLQSLYEFIDQEKMYLQCPAEGPDELRYFLYRSVFNKVINQMTASKRLLLNIKTEYEKTIRELKRREDEAASQQTVVTSTTRQQTLKTCQRQAAQLRDIISILQSQTSGLQEEIKRRNSENQRLWLPVAPCTKETDEDCCSRELIKDKQSMGQDELDHLNRFVELFKSARYEEAALHAARAPGGVLRSSVTMEMFKGVDGPPWSAPPALLFFQALLVTVGTGNRLPAEVSLQGVSCSLKHGDMQLVTHAVTQNKLMFSEDLGDVLTEHAQKNPFMADLSLALATFVYESCRVYRKSALSMCRRGFIHSAAEFMKLNLTAGECMWVICHSGSLSLLQLLTDAPQGQAAMLSVGVACSSLLADPQQHQLALQLLNGFMSRGQDVLEDIIINDGGSTMDQWDQVASLCSGLGQDILSQTIQSVLWDQNRTGTQSPDLEGACLMEHVFL
ncbi:clathrin heavy chain linker domain-containing protein 1-like [Nematolebias whitei]|uniref:clathrin heavy chain linker domain-containing protein 1-like n=1 Tax=Nematolebias whitei TaxID=451745 RepID=UPI00189A4866|nr:clathrin heavy chain linker domain-containing protein 1-like [Nematolebias whitei]